jgi:hypothetical protein
LIKIEVMARRLIKAMHQLKEDGSKRVRVGKEMNQKVAAKIEEGKT